MNGKALTAADSPSSKSSPTFVGDGFRDKVVIVTGAAQGIGQATALAFGESGAKVVLAARDYNSCEETISKLQPDRTLFVKTDVTDETQVAELVSATLKTFGRLDIAFNNAGIFGKFTPLHEDSFENFENVVATNVRGIWLCMKYEIGAMLRGGQGVIVNCSSVAGHIGHPQSAVYSASKHAVIGLTKSAALQYGHDDIRINAISPGSTDTPMLRSIYTDDEELLARSSRAPLGRLGTPIEIAHAVMWLASPWSSYVTGQAIAIDGGVTAGQARKR